MRLVLRGLRGDSFAARTRHVIEGTALVHRVRLDDLYEVLDEVVPALQLDVDVCPDSVGSIAQPDKLVVGDDGPEDARRQQAEEHPHRKIEGVHALRLSTTGG